MHFCAQRSICGRVALHGDAAYAERYNNNYSYFSNLSVPLSVLVGMGSEQVKLGSPRCNFLIVRPERIANPWTRDGDDARRQACVYKPWWKQRRRCCAGFGTAVSLLSRLTSYYLKYVPLEAGTRESSESVAGIMLLLAILTC